MYTKLVTIPEGEGKLGKVDFDVETIQKWILKIKRVGSVEWIQLAQNEFQWRSFSNVVMYFLTGYLLLI
jgi:hypothetical protein